MTKETWTTICVTYKHTEDGWHVFASEEIPGLYVASQNALAAYNDLPTAIETLILLDEGFKCRAVPEMTYSDFVKSMKADQPVKLPSAPRLTTQRFTVMPIAA